MERVDVAYSTDTVDVVSAPGHPQQQQRELSEIERQHQFSLISPLTELTLTSGYVGVGQPSGVTTNSADESFRITGNGVCTYLSPCSPVVMK